MAELRLRPAEPIAEAPPAAGPSLPERAAEDLRSIRSSMERASLFTAVPGRGGMAMGLVGLAGAAFAARQPDGAAWLRVWLVAAAVALAVGLPALGSSARAAGQPLSGPTGRRFLLALAPALTVGGALTVALAARGLTSVLPGVWLLCYGAGTTTCGLLSLRLVAVMGAGFMLLGMLALALPSAGDLCLAAGFGGLHVLIGALIAHRHRAEGCRP